MFAYHNRFSENCSDNQHCCGLADAMQMLDSMGVSRGIANEGVKFTVAFSAPCVQVDGSFNRRYQDRFGFGRNPYLHPTIKYIVKIERNFYIL